jgi:hypothetical protein
MLNALVVVGALRRHLVLDLDRCGAGLFQQPNAASHVNRIPEADAAIDDDSDFDAFGDRPARFAHLRGGEQCLRDASLIAKSSAAEVHGIESGADREGGRKCVERQRSDHQLRCRPDKTAPKVVWRHSRVSLIRTT